MVRVSPGKPHSASEADARSGYVIYVVIKRHDRVDGRREIHTVSLVLAGAPAVTSRRSSALAKPCGRMSLVPDGHSRAHLDLGEYAKKAQTNRCFVCRVVDRTHHFQHAEIYRDEFAVGFLNRFPTLYGYALVAPLAHVAGVVTDMPEEDYIRLQRVVHRIGRAISAVVPTERLYVLSLGSEQGNAHIHWHVAPLPPGVPYEQQQYAALMMETSGYLDLTPQEHEELALRIRNALPLS